MELGGIARSFSPRTCIETGRALAPAVGCDAGIVLRAEALPSQCTPPVVCVVRSMIAVPDPRSKNPPQLQAGTRTWTMVVSGL
eukprot:2400707-Rhodomonas_salina.1